MTNAGFATLGIIPSAQGMKAALEKQIHGDMQSVGRSSGRQLAAGLRSAIGPALAGVGIASAFQDVIGKASDAEQAVGGLSAVFGEYAEQARKDSESSAQSLGLARTEYQELLTLSGALLKNKGLKDFADQSRRLLSIGADLAATYGGSTKDAVDALNSALRGESDPIERYAISLNETAVNAKLAALGLSDLKGTALEQAKTSARLALIMEQSADAQGAFARESDTAAGAAQRASAQWADMRRELGEKLLPAYSATTNALNQGVLPALSGAGGVIEDTVGAFGKLPEPIKLAAGAYIALQAASAGATAANTALAASFAKVKGSAIASRLSVAGFARTAGSIAVLAGAFELLQRMAPDQAEADRYVETLQKMAGADIDDQIKALEAAIKKQQKIIDDAFGPTFQVFGSRVTPFEFGSDWKEAGAKVDSLKAQLAELKHQQNLNAIETERAARENSRYSLSIQSATTTLQGLIDKENERRANRLKDRRDSIALQQVLADARAEAQEGAKTLDITTQAGRDNSTALLDLAEQWNNSTNKVKNARGAYENIRTAFINLADEMNGPGGTRAQAKALADQLLDIPRNGPYNADLKIPGLPDALENLREAQAILNSMRRGAVAQGNKNRDELADLRRDFVPTQRSTSSGDSGSWSRTTTNGPAVYIANQTVQAHSYDDFLQQQQRYRRMSALDGIQR